MKNIIDAIINIVNHPVVELREVYTRKNRANSAGDALEEYVKDLFAGTFHCANEQERIEKIADTFSYLGNDRNPPDGILRDGDALEVKKIEANNSTIALNSSYPKHKLHRDSTMIAQTCREAEDWTEKDIIYIVGVVQKNNLRHLCMVYGLDYCASVDAYEPIRQTIKEGIESIPDIELVDTTELGKMNKVDPLGITGLRVRGMWEIKNPFKVFEYVFERDMSKKLNFMAIINDEKYRTFDNRKKIEDLEKENACLTIKDEQIKDPDNPAQQRSAKLITYLI